MEGIMLGVGNDSYGIASMSEAADKLDKAFLSRFLLYEQTDSHIEWIEDRKYDIDEQEAEYPDGDTEFISLIDHLSQKVEVNVDKAKVRDIKEEVEEQVPSNFDAIYRSRYDHHIKNLVSGHSKYRSMIEGTLDFEAKEEDYRFAHEIIEMIVNSWVKNANLEKMSLQARPYYLQKDKREVFEIIRHQYPIDINDLQERYGDSVGYKVGELKDLDLVEKIDDQFYPYFADTVVENDNNKKFGYINNGEGE